ncbi:MAG: type II toxin-antitoxin system RelE/ParE family toxin [Alkalinema sp. RL_2_19]|nr:type II toxin-antitoxin system RelE/ParE family toxin [Alkalinema sp. RL_2_19]
MRELIIAPEALQDLNAVADYFVDRDVEAGEFLFQRFNQRCRQLANFPLSGALLHEWRIADEVLC